MPKIFISYRRDDSAYVADAIRNRLESHFGKKSIFMDVDSIHLGVDFRKVLTDAVFNSDVLLAIIGTDWLGKNQENELPRINNPQDFVRIEVEFALSRGIPVVPVLVDDAKLPNTNELPESLHELLFRNAAEVRPGRDLKPDLDALSYRLARQLNEAQKAKGPINKLFTRSIKIGGASLLIAAIVFGAIKIYLAYAPYLNKKLPSSSIINNQFAIEPSKKNVENTTQIKNDNLKSIAFSEVIFFDRDKSIIKPQYFAKLDEFVSRLGKISVTSITLIAHYDPTDNSLEFVDRKADAVKKYLVSKGVSSQKISIHTTPDLSLSNDEARANSRRVEINAVGSEAL